MKSQTIKENAKKLKKLTALIIFVIMLLFILCYAIGLDKYLNPTPKADPQVSSWGQSEDVDDFSTKPTETE